MRETAASKAWKAKLAPMANDYSAMVDAIIRLCAMSTDEGLVSLLDASRQPTQTNCWWATYAVAPIVQEEAKREQYRRAQIADVPVDASLGGGGRG